MTAEFVSSRRGTSIATRFATYLLPSGGFRHDGEDEAAVGVGADGAVGNDEVIARALLPDGHGYLRAGGDVAVKVEGEKLIRHGVLFIRLDGAERGDDLIAL